MSADIWLKVRPYRHGIRAEGSFVKKNGETPHLFFKDIIGFGEWIDEITNAPPSALKPSIKGEVEK